MIRGVRMFIGRTGSHAAFFATSSGSRRPTSATGGSFDLPGPTSGVTGRPQEGSPFGDAEHPFYCDDIKKTVGG